MSKDNPAMTVGDMIEFVALLNQYDIDVECMV